MENNSKEFQLRVAANLAQSLRKIGNNDMNCVTTIHYRLDSCYSALMRNVEKYSSIAGIGELENLLDTLRDYAQPFFYEDDEPQSIRLNTPDDIAEYLAEGIFDVYGFYSKFGTNQVRMQVHDREMDRLGEIRTYLQKSFLKIMRLLTSVETASYYQIVAFSELFDVLINGLYPKSEPHPSEDDVKPIQGESNPDEHLSRLEKAAA